MYQDNLEILFGNKHAPTDELIPSYCNCVYPCPNIIANFEGELSTLVTCRCGERTNKALAWGWEKPEFDDIVDCNIMHPVRLSGDFVKFHPVCSQGTAIVSGNRPLQAGKRHFWEYQFVTSLEGTDVMFGIGSDKFELNAYLYQFISAIGMDDESWGISYTGFVQHNGVSQRIAHSFSKGCILGIRVDRITGTMSFEINRTPVRFSYTNIPTDPSTILYPLISCTTAKTVVRLLSAESEPSGNLLHD